MSCSGGILLAVINAKWIHPSLALRLLKANLGPLEEKCHITEFALRQPLCEKTDPILSARPRILGISVSIWNHTATVELLRELRKQWRTGNTDCSQPFIVLGGPEVSYLNPDAEIFTYADVCVRGEGETAFRRLCEAVFYDGIDKNDDPIACFAALERKKIFSETGENFSSLNINGKFVEAGEEDLPNIKSGYDLYTDEDLHRKLVYVEAGRGCPHRCEFCLSAVSKTVREFPLEPFLAEMDELVRRGAGTFKFLDRTFNLDVSRARRVMEFFLEKIEERSAAPENSTPPLVVHFEMVPSRFPPELVETIARFPPGTLRLEIGIQTLNGEVSARIGRPARPERELSALSLLREKTAAIIHADLIAGLPGEDMESFGRGFDLLYAALNPPAVSARGGESYPQAEMQLGILKLLPGTPLARHTEPFGMCYSSSPPYELLESATLPRSDLDRIKTFARFWELTVNRGLFNPGPAPVFARFMALSDSLFARFGRSWGIAKDELLKAVGEIIAGG